MRCAGIPADPAYGQLMVRAVRSEFKSGVKRGKRNAKEAGGIQHMVVCELQAALKKKSDRSRQLARKLMAVQEQLVWCPTSRYFAQQICKPLYVLTICINSLAIDASFYMLVIVLCTCLQ